MGTYKQVTRDQFWDYIMSMTDKSIHPKIEGNHPYSSDFLDASGKSHGKILPVDQSDAMAGYKYLLADS
jgi:hypothetical protein